MIQIKLVERAFGRLVRSPCIRPLGEIVPVGGMDHGRKLCACLNEHKTPPGCGRGGPTLVVFLLVPVPLPP